VELHRLEEEEDEMLKEVEKQINLASRRVVGDFYTQIKTALQLLNRPRVASPQKRIIQPMA
jgi:hypothetical protein